MAQIVLGIPMHIHDIPEMRNMKNRVIVCFTYSIKKKPCHPWDANVPQRQSFLAAWEVNYPQENSCIAVLPLSL